MPEARVLELLRSRCDWTGGPMARCPAPTHGQRNGDRRPSLSVRVSDDGAALLHCFGGCPVEAIVGALGCSLADLFPPRQSNGSGGRTMQTDYEVRDADGKLRAIKRRFDKPDGTKTFAWLHPDGRRSRGGEIKPRALPLYGSEHLPKRLDEDVVIVEGEKAARALLDAGVLAVGTVTGASGTPGPEALAVLEGRSCVLWADADGPGRRHMDRLGAALSKLALGDLRRLDWPDAPDGGDAADFLAELRRAGNAREAVSAAVRALLESAAPWTSSTVTATRRAKTDDEPKQSDGLFMLAKERYRIGRASDGEPFAVPVTGPNVALPLSSKELHAVLAREYRRRFKTIPSGNAMREALTALSGEALESEAERAHVRTARHEDGIVLDLGTADGKAVVVDPSGWTVVDRSPVLFRRTALTGAHEPPTGGGDLERLRELLRIDPEVWPLLLAWLVATFLPDIPCPALLVGGTKGGGKSFLARLLVALTDPSPAPLRSQPTNARDWAVPASGSRVVAIDNISAIPPWWSDALCKAVTGDGWASRALYSNADVSVLTIRCAPILTSIDPGALRGDLGDRLVLIDREEIPESARRAEADLDAEFRAMRPALVGALLDLLARVLTVLPNVQPKRLPRMADFHRLVLAVDRILGTNGAAVYAGQETRVAEDVLDGDPLGAALVRLVEERTTWEGTTTDLLRLLVRDDGFQASQCRPRSPAAMAASLKRLEPSLKRLGTRIERTRRPGGNRTRILRIGRVPVDTVPTVPPVPPDAETDLAAAPCDSSRSKEPGPAEGRLEPSGEPVRPAVKETVPAPAARPCERSPDAASGRDGGDGRDSDEPPPPLQSALAMFDGEVVDPSSDPDLFSESR